MELIKLTVLIQLSGKITTATTGYINIIPTDAVTGKFPHILRQKITSGFHNLETAFSQDLDNDGFTGSPPVNGGQAKFTISGTKKAGQTLTINQSSTDPDGLNGSYSYQWQRSGDGKTWNNISNTTNTYTILGSDEGNQIRAQITYTDNQGFREEVTTTSLTIPIPVTVTNTENDGSITLAKDSNGYGYAAIKGTDEFIAITDQRGNPIGDKTYSGWSLIGADKVNEVNTTVWKHNNGNYWIHKHNSNWAVTKGGYPETKNSSSFHNLETAFSQDLNNDSQVGEPDTKAPDAPASLTNSSPANDNTYWYCRIRQYGKTL